jgi:hypothetical protein
VDQAELVAQMQALERLVEMLLLLVLAHQLLRIFLVALDNQAGYTLVAIRL